MFLPNFFSKNNDTKGFELASAATSLEEGYLARQIAQRLGAGPCLIVSPATSDIADDGKLISTDRFPNRTGLLALGYQPLRYRGMATETRTDGKEVLTRAARSSAIFVANPTIGDQ